ncbi:MAG: Flp pilus assembly protein CpaB [Planctomycetota bacterium]|nr:Flp pilus assembly protein CpaB [Planctomycetota bacterium]
MNPRMLALGMAVFCGLGAAYLAMTYKGNQGPKMVEVLRTKSKVPFREKISDPQKYFEVVAVPELNLPSKILISFEQVKDKSLNKTLTEQSFVTSDDLLGANQHYLTDQLDKGKRLFGLTVNAESLAGGFILPGATVDLIGTKRLVNNNIETQTVLENIRVMAVGDKSTINEKQGDVRHSIIETTVTLEVSPEEAQILAMWKSIGEIKLSARAKDDIDKVNTKTTKLNEDVKANDVLKNEPEKKKIKKNIFGGNENKFETFIHRPKDVKDNAINIEIVEYEFKDGKWRTVFKNNRNSNAVEQPDEVPADVPEKVKQ